MNSSVEVDLTTRFTSLADGQQRHRRTELSSEIELIRRSFPRHVMDARKLYKAMEADGLLFLAQGHEGNPAGDVPSSFAHYLVEPQVMLGGNQEMVDVISSSPNGQIYTEVNQTYFAWHVRSPEEVNRQLVQGLTEDEKNDRRSSNLFDHTFGLVKQLATVYKQAPEVY